MANITYMPAKFRMQNNKSILYVILQLISEVLLGYRIDLMTRKKITQSKVKEYFNPKTTKKEKGRILDILVEDTGWSRDNARRQLRNAALYPDKNGRQGRRKKYSERSRIVLSNIWVLSGSCCGMYLKSQIDNGLIERLINYKELRVAFRNKGALLPPDDHCIREIKEMSPATIDRYLKDLKKRLNPLSKSTTKPCSNSHLRNEIPFGKSYNKHKEPGYLSVDTVAHCGNTLKGTHLWSIDMTDVLTGWTLIKTIPSKASSQIKGAHEELMPQFPFPILGINYDGGSEFINQEMIDYSELVRYEMTRSRPYKSNDNAHVEQKNYDLIRKNAFRYRYEGFETLVLLNEIWHFVCLRKNFLIPTRKCIDHTKTKSGRTRGVYDEPKTPYQRVLELESVNIKEKEELKLRYKSLNDAEITRNILNRQETLIALAKDSDLVEFVKQEVAKTCVA